MEVGVWGRSPHEARRRRENFSGFYRFRHRKRLETAYNRSATYGSSSLQAYWDWIWRRQHGIGGCAYAGTQFSSRAGCRNSRKQLWRVAGERRAPPTHEHSAQHSSILKTRQTPTLVFARFRPHSPSSSCVAKWSCCGCCALDMYSQQHRLRASHQAQAVKARLKTGGCKNEVRHC